ncbi:MAG: hypothetical protein IKU86_02655 [Thermoguttaceae bacterium]|nr:hypothetical protein [Thermoguttaceae bacterium]
MAIRVICSGCMTSFEVGDQFAGQKGPCPKCGHIIEIPKVQVVVHAPDEVVQDGKTTRVGKETRPIEQKRFEFSTTGLLLSLLGILLVFGAAFGVGLAKSTVLSGIVGAVAVFGIAFPIARFGYMLIRDADDLEKLEGGELTQKALFAALVFGGSWIVFEIFVALLGNQGLTATLLLIPVAVVGSFGALIFFDCNFGKALLVYAVFAACAVFGRGLLFQPHGWIWEARPNASAPAPKLAVSKSKPKAPAAEAPETEETDANEALETAETEEADAEAAPTREAPKPNPIRRRR